MSVCKYVCVGYACDFPFARENVKPTTHKTSQINGWTAHTVNISFTYLLWLHAFLSMCGDFCTVYIYSAFKIFHRYRNQVKKSCFWAKIIIALIIISQSNSIKREIMSMLKSTCDKILSYHRFSKTLHWSIFLRMCTIQMLVWL